MVLLGSLYEAKVILYSLVMLMAVLRIGSIEFSFRLETEARLLPRLLEPYEKESLAIDSLGALAL
jgi:hypothetical protein